MPTSQGWAPIYRYSSSVTLRNSPEGSVLGIGFLQNYTYAVMPSVILRQHPKYIAVVSVTKAEVDNHIATSAVMRVFN